MARASEGEDQLVLGAAVARAARDSGGVAVVRSRSGTTTSARRGTARCYGRGHQILNLEHYLDVLEKKPGAMAGSTPLQQWRQAGRWPECLDRIWEQLEQRHGQERRDARDDHAGAGRLGGRDGAG